MFPVEAAGEASRATGSGRLDDRVTGALRRADYITAGHWDDSTLSQLVRTRATEHGDRLAVVSRAGDRRRSYRDLDRDVDRVAAFLCQVGVAPGDVVAVQLPNWYETVVVGLAVLRVGAVLNPMITIYRRRELAHMLAVGNTRVIFLPEVYRGFDHATMAAELAVDLPGLLPITIADPAVDPDWFDVWLQTLPEPAALPVTRADAVSQLLFSSGTEAVPKAIMHTEQTAGFGVRSAARSLGLGPRDVVWMPSPIGHSTGANFGVRMALTHGLPLVLQDRWNAAAAADLVSAEGCTYTLAATTFLTDLVRHCSREGLRLPTLRLFGSGGAPVPAELVVAARTCGIEVMRLYGSTEVLVATWNRPSSPEAKLRETDGVPVDAVEVEVRDNDGLAVIGRPGEIVVRGPACSVGFLDDPGRTAATFDPEGWVHSGDLGVLDDSGYLRVVGRMKEIIIRGGMNIAPREVEELILRLPGVVGAVVVGVPDERLGEIGCACVVLAPDTTLTLRGLVDALRATGLAAYKLPEQLAIVSELPSTPSGKVQKHRLIDAITDPTCADRHVLLQWAGA